MDAITYAKKGKPGYQLKKIGRRFLYNENT